MGVSRREFLGRVAGLGAGALVTNATLQTIGTHAAWAREHANRKIIRPGMYGPLSVRPSVNTGESLVALPEEFAYWVVDKTGDPFSDGTSSPIAFDGMACFPHPESRGHVRLIRNSEVRTTPGTEAGRVFAGPAESRYDESGVGGCVTLDVDLGTMTPVERFVSINGTIVNCAGGLMLDNQGWVTCEETTAGPASGWQQKHGYCFVVPLQGPAPGAPVDAEPIPAMGRFAHEAVAVDPATGYVYETEDQSGIGNGFYRYIPTDPRNLAAGGELFMLKVAGEDGYDTRDGQTQGVELPVEWVRIDNPDPDFEGDPSTPSVAAQGIALGAAKFNRLEGIWAGHKRIYFDSTSGGSVKNGDNPNPDGYLEGYGQIWEYDPRKESIRLLFQSTGGSVLDSPDNLTVTPHGSLLLCEDDASSVDADTHALAPGITNINRLIGLTANGEPFEFAVNVVNDSEFAGACFSPRGETLFVNLFGDSAATDPAAYTLAIQGPWHKGPL